MNNVFRIDRCVVYRGKKDFYIGTLFKVEFKQNSASFKIHFIQVSLYKESVKFSSNLGLGSEISLNSIIQ